MTHRDLWLSVLKRIKPTIKKANFLTWFQNSIVIDKKDDVVVVGFPTMFSKDWIVTKYKLKILQAFQEIDDKISVVEYEICSRLAEKENKDGVDVKGLFAIEDEKRVRKVRNMNEVKVTRGSGHVSSQMLNEKYCLSNFVVGKENRLPHAACAAVAGAPGGIYNPLYIYGNTGLGKTHLLQAVGNEILRNFPEKIVKYVTAERFVTEVVEAIGKRHMPQFKNLYRKVDCFLVDDVQFFARKDSSQQEFFHTFNELYDNNKQVIVTSDKPPSELQDLDVRLKGRCGMGMVIELLFPEFETRLAILQQKCQEFEVIVDPEVLQFIANNVHHSVRELEGVLRQVVAESQLFEKVPTIRSVAEIIKRLNKAQEIIGYDIESRKGCSVVRKASDVIHIVAEYYSISVDELMGKDRHKEVMIPRQICMYLIKNELDFSYESIGVNFGGRNHTTVMHACNKTANRLRKDIKLVRDVNAIKREMGL